MRNTVKEWKEEWIETNGLTNELEVVIKDSKLHESQPSIYEGNFAGIPERLLGKKVLESSQIIASSVPEREGAYSLLV